jgi:SH3 domain-containing YSC84-like protein 1
VTDFVFILNDAAAVRAFSQQASLTFGGNVSIAAGPVGRNAEAAGAASLKGFAGVFAYSKTKGLFAGVSLEGSVLIERRDANEKLYNSKVTARQLLEGSIRPPPAADPLLNILNSRVFSGNTSSNSEAIYNDIPIYDDSHDNVVWEGRTGQGYGSSTRRDRSGTISSHNDGDYEYRDNAGSGPKRASTWADDVYDRTPANRSSALSRVNPSETFDRINRNSRSNTLSPGAASEYSYSDQKKPTRPTAPKPVFKQRTGSLGKDQARALFTFDADQDGDLGFKKGDIITIMKRTDNGEDWWTGRIGEREGIFPSNYVESLS